MSVRLYAWNNLAPAERIFMKFDFCGFFEKKTVKKVQVSLYSEKKNECFTCAFVITFRSVRLRMFKTGGAVKNKAHFIFVVPCVVILG